jgi:hypothetical protein
MICHDCKYRGSCAIAYGLHCLAGKNGCAISIEYCPKHREGVPDPGRITHIRCVWDSDAGCADPVASNLCRACKENDSHCPNFIPFPRKP